MTIEQRLLKDWGTTGDPRMATWMLADGTLVNGSHEGRQRDVDHREINEYYKPSKRAVPGSGMLYVLKFMRRGNVRVCCNDYCYGVEMIKPPTRSQFEKIAAIMRRAELYGVDTHVDRCLSDRRTRSYTWPEYVRYLMHHMPRLMADYPAITARYA